VGFANARREARPIAVGEWRHETRSTSISCKALHEHGRVATRVRWSGPQPDYRAEAQLSAAGARNDLNRLRPDTSGADTAFHWQSPTRRTDLTGRCTPLRPAGRDPLPLREPVPRRDGPTGSRLTLNPLPSTSRSAFRVLVTRASPAAVATRPSSARSRGVFVATTVDRRTISSERRRPRLVLDTRTRS
jgi:hypothetical protein